MANELHLRLPIASKMPEEYEKNMQIMNWIKREILHLLLVFLFFLFFFTVINSIETYLVEKSGIKGFRFLQVAVAAGLIAKIIVVVDHLPILHRFRKYPLAFSILWKTLFYWAILFIVRLLIRFTPFFWHDTYHFANDLSRFYDRVEWNVFLSIQAYYLLVLFIFVVFQELISKIGLKRSRELFFGREKNS